MCQCSVPLTSSRIMVFHPFIRSCVPEYPRNRQKSLPVAIGMPPCMHVAGLPQLRRCSKWPVTTVRMTRPVCHQSRHPSELQPHSFSELAYNFPDASTPTDIEHAGFGTHGAAGALFASFAISVRHSCSNPAACLDPWADARPPLCHTLLQNRFMTRADAGRHLSRTLS